MNMPYFFAFLPILISFASLLVSFIHGSNKNKTGIIDNLSKELSSKRVTPYVVQVCVSRIHNSRPIQFSILKKLLNYNDALEIIQLFSYGRKVLDIFKFSEDGNRILVGYSQAYNTFTSRLMSMLVCLLSLLVCYSASVYFMIEIMFSLNQMNSMGSVGVEAGDVIFKSIGLIFFMLMTFGFSWQFVIIFGSGKRIKKIQKLIDGNYSRKNHSRNR
ncbi:hypothetical protein UP00_13870 [Enterobacter asburiae]|uniref:Uncharacterized protein n=1 Tax=Enterobacter asburiae TaxID=61645 RepID=A0AAW7ZVI8_ENTAS|nr:MULTISPECIES: hypothetical protein [Enterobacter]ALL17750.1 hypothetical protein NI40_011455 [Enterobacter sp. E20]ELF1046748.1 hypothetical protein [Enterobacter asburiae]KJI62169.1 hypothetical protein UP00_13870 [Enterobacter asburiae]KJW89168.1 hypothetical protein SG67_08950 [Enterobacter asburiae]KJX12104.1 hypothetical protein SG66_11370 [Enterobacter asburiae]